MIIRIERTSRAHVSKAKGERRVLSSALALVPSPLRVYTQSRWALGAISNNRFSLFVTHPQSNTLEQLLVRIRQGEQAAFASFYDHTAARVFGLTKRILRKTELAEDATAEAYAQAWTQAHAFDQTRGSALAWLMTIARSRALDILRRRARETPLLDDVPEEASAEEMAIDSFAVVAQFERESCIAHALEALTNTQRQCIALSFFQDLSHAEIAAQLGMPLGTVKTHIRGAIHIMREQLGNSQSEQEKSA